MVYLHEAKTQLSRLLERVQAGEETILAQTGKPRARLAPFGPTPLRGQSRYLLLEGDPPDSYFELLSAEEPAAWDELPCGVSWMPARNRGRGLSPDGSALELVVAP